MFAAALMRTRAWVGSSDEYQRGLLQCVGFLRLRSRCGSWLGLVRLRVLPLPAGPSSNNGFCIFAARKTTLVMVGSMKYPVSESFSDSSSAVSNMLASFSLDRVLNDTEHRPNS